MNIHAVFALTMDVTNQFVKEYAVKDIITTFGKTLATDVRIHIIVKPVPVRQSVSCVKMGTGDFCVITAVADARGCAQWTTAAFHAEMGFILCRTVTHAARSVETKCVIVRMVDVLMGVQMVHTDHRALENACQNVRLVLMIISAPVVMVQHTAHIVRIVVFLGVCLVAMVPVANHAKMDGTARMLRQDVNVRVKNVAYTVTVFVVPANKIRPGTRREITVVLVLLHAKIVLAIKTVHVLSVLMVNMVSFAQNHAVINVME